MYVDMKKASIRLLIGGFVIALLGRNLANAAAKTEVVQFNNKFDFYLLATQWIPGWCEVGSGQSGAIIDNLRACQQQVNRPLMFHGVWPENNDGSYPSFCSLVPKLDPTKLTFANPFKNYLSNANDFLDHEWNKHGTCSNHYSSGLEHNNSNEYYTQINLYFTQGLNLYQKIQIPTLDLELKTTELQAIINKENSQIPSDAILVMCDSDHHQQQYLTGLWFCTNKAQDKFIPCPLPLQKNACTGTVITR
jgi:ribonuclease I